MEGSVMAWQRDGRWGSGSGQDPRDTRFPGATSPPSLRPGPHGHQRRERRRRLISRSASHAGRSQRPQRPNRPNRTSRSSRPPEQPAFVLPLALVAGLVVSASSLGLLATALASHQAQAADQRRRQADDGLRDLAQLLAQQLVGQRPEVLNPASLGPDLLALALPAGWQLGGLQWQPSEPADLGLITLQVTLKGRGGEQRLGLVHFDRSLGDGRILALHQEGA